MYKSYTAVGGEAAPADAGHQIDYSIMHAYQQPKREEKQLRVNLSIKGTPNHPVIEITGADHIGLLERVAECFKKYKYSVRTARLETRGPATTRVVKDTFELDKVQDDADAALLEELRRDLEQAAFGPQKGVALHEYKYQQDLFQPAKRQVEVEIQGRAGSHSPGLLYQIAHTVFQHGFNIVRATIVTHADGRITNHFRLQETYLFQKLLKLSDMPEEDYLNQLKAALEELHLNPSPLPSPAGSPPGPSSPTARQAGPAQTLSPPNTDNTGKDHPLADSPDRQSGRGSGSVFSLSPALSVPPLEGAAGRLPSLHSPRLHPPVAISRRRSLSYDQQDVDHAGCVDHAAAHAETASDSGMVHTDTTVDRERDGRVEIILTTTEMHSREQPSGGEAVFRGLREPDAHVTSFAVIPEEQEMQGDLRRSTSAQSHQEDLTVTPTSTPIPPPPPSPSPVSGPLDCDRAASSFRVAVYPTNAWERIRQFISKKSGRRSSSTSSHHHHHHNHQRHRHHSHTAEDAHSEPPGVGSAPVPYAAQSVGSLPAFPIRLQHDRAAFASKRPLSLDSHQAGGPIAEAFEGLGPSAGYFVQGRGKRV
ncbi:unnamed protein product [Vitrella brassicaformis CCMP3155]|uniref:ACT domain-containing protein n=3 Tax=Vitrella brassicaformis TaxID=1169539 RepID=A0A0G4F270_VITBC|nr:unnamed protein product [Vitrella brassicaformis CCMP3155]|mmetsp:Transcript_11614/g.33799  ORF Transcript_11614/g.33799 Transcript_11614/m.33799 type:complete len:592 (+) Transcript_11614:80-1855(+)|eukprot:CEM05721.1 unnamed protein product [Vitrella brassicaformis CCMP3155]